MPSFGEDLPEEMADDYFRYFLGMRVLEMYRTISERPATLFIEPHNGCQIRCKYCYAEVWHHEKGHFITAEQVADLYQKYQFESVMIYGGDIFFNWELGQKIIKAVSGVKTIFISTNGLGLTPDRIAFIREHCQKFELQLSIEPREWGQRVTQKADVHQNDALKHLHKVNKLVDFVFNITIPAKQIDKWTPSLAPYHREIEDLIGTDKYISGWQLQDEPNCPLPPWVSAWLTEETFELQDDSYDFARAMKGMSAVALSHWMTMARDSSKIIPGYYFNCNAGMGSLAIGPDGQLYSCHEKAVSETDSFRIETASPRGLYQLMKKKINNMDNEICKKCPAHYTCGGICFAYLSTVRCDFERQRLPLGLEAATKLFPHDMVELGRRQREMLSLFRVNYEHIREDVRSQEWHDMVSGDLPVEQVAALAQRSLGISPKLDTLLWELPGPGEARMNSYRALTV